MQWENIGEHSPRILLFLSMKSCELFMVCSCSGRHWGLCKDPLLLSKCEVMKYFSRHWIFEDCVKLYGCEIGFQKERKRLFSHVNVTKIWYQRWQQLFCTVSMAK